MSGWTGSITGCQSCYVRDVFKKVPWQLDQTGKRAEENWWQIKLAVDWQGDQKDGWGTCRLDKFDWKSGYCGVTRWQTDGVWQAEAGVWHRMPSDMLWQLALLTDSGLSQWVKVAMGDWHKDSGVRGLEVLTFGWTCMTGASLWIAEEEEHCWIKLMKSGNAGSEKGKKERSGHKEVSGLITAIHTHMPTHTRWGCGPFAVTWVEIAQLVTKTSCLSALTVLGVLGAPHQLLHCELCRTNVNLLLSFGHFKLEQRGEDEYIKKINSEIEENGWEEHTLLFP